VAEPGSLVSLARVAARPLPKEAGSCAELIPPNARHERPQQLSRYSVFRQG
jgi:hypothetical protein